VQKLAEVCIRRPVFAAMIIMALTVVGAASWLRLGVDRFPSVDLPTVFVRTELPGAAPEEMETQVAKRIEEAVNSIEGINELRSVSGPGTSFVIVTFNLDRDIDVAAQDVRDKVGTVLRDLPRDTLPPVVSKFDNDQSPVMTVSLSGPRSLRELTELADKIVKVQLERASGVGQVRLVGGLQRAINVWVDADRLAAYQIPITAVRDAVVRQNADLPGGNVTAGGREESLRTMGRIADPHEFGEILVLHTGGVPIRIRDIGWVEDGAREQRSSARANGVPTVVLEVRRQSRANTVATIDAAKAALPRAQAQLPPDVRIEVLRDQSRYIHAALHEINVHLVLGSILASIVVLAFMRSWRATIIAAVAIPASVIATFGMMRALDFTLNSVTMLALVLMVGIVIDDAIVVLENIFRFVEEKGMRPFEAARAATEDIGLAVMATTFSLVVIFVPVSFMSSISGRFLYQFGLTAAVAVLVSLLVSFTLTPMMSARLLSAEHAAAAHQGEVARSRRGFYGWLDRGYERTLAFSMRHRLFIAALSLAVVASSLPFYRLVKQEYIPSDVDEGEFEIIVTGPRGLSFAAMDQLMRDMTQEIQAVRGVRLVLAQAGGGFLANVSDGNVYVRIAPHDERTLLVGRLWRATLDGDPMAAFRGNYSQRDVMQEVRRRLRKFTGVRALVRNVPGFNIGGGNFDIDLALRGPDLEGLSRHSERLRERALELGGILDPYVTLTLDKPELRVRIDRARAADLGVDAESIATALRLMVGGDEKVSRFRDAALNEEYDVQLRLTAAGREDPATISRLYVRRANGELTRLDNLIAIETAKTATRIDRLDRERLSSLRAALGPGYGLADRLEALRHAARELDMPASYSVRVVGRGRELERTFGEFIWVFVLSVVFMYMILAAQFESLVHPLTILLSLPLSVPFGLLSLWLTGNTLNLYSALGILVLFGVVKKNAILQIDHTNNLRAAGVERADAIIQANRDRLRPILMTTLALVAGMIPLALGAGPGAEERRAIAVVVIGGQMLSLLLTLLITPVAYSLFEDAARALSWSPPAIARRGRWARWMRRWPAVPASSAGDIPARSSLSPLGRGQGDGAAPDARGRDPHPHPLPSRERG
jgi:HAE1 family hydrophobic/amphiphilic exporter-1